MYIIIMMMCGYDYNKNEGRPHFLLTLDYNVFRNHIAHFKHWEHNYIIVPAHRCWYVCLDMLYYCLATTKGTNA